MADPQRVLLVFPGLHFERGYPLGLASLAASLRRAGHRVDGCDLGLEPHRALHGKLASSRYDWVGVATWAANRGRAARIVREATALGARTLIGGPHATLRPEEALRETGAALALLGEADESLVALVEATGRGEPAQGQPGTAWLDEAGCLHRGPPTPAPAPLDALPPPDRRVFDLARYPGSWVRGAPRRAPLLTSRGCPAHCTHCCAPALHHGRWRPRSPAAVVEEMVALAREHGIGLVQVEDEQPLVDRDRFLALCDRLANEHRRPAWNLPNGLRPEQLDRELLAAMARAGCVQLALGVESASSSTLAALGRHPDLEPARAATRWARELGIDVSVYFVLGLPDTGPGASRAALRAAVALGATSAHFGLYDPVPGAALDGQRRAGDPAWVLRRGLLYLAWYGHPARAYTVLDHAGAGLGDLPAAARRFGAWLGYGGGSRG